MKLSSIITIAMFGLIVTLLAGCGSGTQEPPAVAESTAAEQDTASGEATLVDREAAIAEREKDVAQREAAMAKPQSGSTASTAKTVAAAPPPQPASSSVEPVAQAPEPVNVVPAAQAPEPVVENIVLTVPSGTMFDVEILDGLSSETSMVGDRFSARLLDDMVVGGEIAVPAGSLVHGSVTEVQPTKKIGGQALLAIDFDTIALPQGESTAFRAGLAQAGKKQTGKDAATIGGATAGGALLGRVLDKKHGSKSTLIGAVVGAAVGTAIAAKNEGDPVTLDIGTVIGLTLDESVHVVIENGQPRFESVASR